MGLIWSLCCGRTEPRGSGQYAVAPMDDTVAALIVPLAAAVVGATASWGIRVVTNRRLRHKYPLGGRFVTEYEDLVEGQRVTKKGVCELGWKGRDVRGNDTNVQEGRSWSLNGRVDRGGYLGGRYRAVDPYDSSTGTFFLQREGNMGDMLGLWAGYDSANRVVVSGSYKFYRSPDATVRAARLDEARRVVSLLGEALGECYVDLAAVQEAIAPDSRSACLVVVDRENRLLGAVTYYLVSKESICRFLPNGQDDIAERLRLLWCNHAVGLLRSIAVAPSYRGRGVATQLTEAGLKWCASEGATAMLAFAWDPPAGSQFAGVLKHSGFCPVMTIDNYWTNDSAAKGYDCPACGAVCHCGAVVYSRALLDQDQRPKHRGVTASKPRTRIRSVLSPTPHTTALSPATRYLPTSTAAASLESADPSHAEPQSALNGDNAQDEPTTPTSG